MASSRGFEALWLTLRDYAKEARHRPASLESLQDYPEERAVQARLRLWGDGQREVADTELARSSPEDARGIDDSQSDTSI